MADVSVKAVSPRITLDLDLHEAKAMQELLRKEREGKAFSQSHPDALSSVRSSLSSGIDMAESIVKGADYVQESATR